MFAEERQEKILEMLKRNRRVSNTELIKQFGVSGTTIRIDLTELEQKGLLSRTHGGAILKEDPVFGEDSISSRREKHREEKICIAKKAREEIQNGDTILLDSGTTALELAKLLEDAKNLTVITNDLQVALQLQKNREIHLILLGGRVRTSFECTVGGMGIRALEELSVDKVFMTTNALSIQKGATTPNLDNAEIKREMMKIGNRKYLLCDSSKIGTKTVCSYAKAAEFDILFTDDHITAEAKNSLEEQGIIVK
ncbi:MAG TPA: DeoR/GlpR family DNA-binding transcription regulator [Candidatus Anaerostipes excrementavium]|uniref:DeoR/GlpR family DNA-binding transcription regulator n=1 Tax=Candidatus Anaerostipes excrementavium TaxID=2838463 RepID=A0A9D2BAC7_9FIRM|nr:DeoR/GlpR family DNA-binding transcription regulator [uncultured Anaerostipes sp.]HIX68876.1 DeoR/GlpR family DNA-binding transcription regulator [Candidatus Anaerostipes excrementavium]